MATRSHRLSTTTATLGVLALLGTTLIACGDDGSDELPPPPASPPAAAPTEASHLDPADAEAAEEILAAFDSYMTGLIELSTEGVFGGSDETMERLEEIHVSGEAYDELAFDLLTANAQEGVATDGSITWDAEVQEIDWDHQYEHRPDEVVPLARLQVCFDETAWVTVDVESREVVGGPGPRYLSDVTVTWRDDDPQRPERQPRWQVSLREDRDDAC